MANQNIDSLKKRIQKFLNEPNKVFHDIHEKTMVELLETISIYQEELEFQNQELRNTQEILMLSEKRFSSLFYGTPIGLVLLNTQLEIVDVNHAFLTLIDYPNEKVKGQLLTNFVHENSQDTFYLYWKNNFNRFNIEEIEIDVKRSNQSTVKVKVQAKPWSMGMKEEQFILLSFDDITELSQSKIKIHHQNFLLEQSQEIALLGSCNFNPNTNTTECSEMLYKIFGFPDNCQADYLDFLKLISEEGKSIWIDCIQNTLQSFEPFSFESEISTYDGQSKWIKVIGKGIILDRERRIISTIQDITQQKLKDKYLRDSEQRYKIVADNTFHWEFWKAPDFSYIYISPSCEGITGYKPEEFMKNPTLYMELIHPEDYDKYINHHVNLPDIVDKEPVEIRITTANGKEKIIAHTCKPIFDDNGTYLGIRGTNIDVTERSEYIQKIENQNKTLKEIAWIQSHELRGAVTRGMSLIPFLQEKDFTLFDYEELVNALQNTFQELDVLIQRISKKTYQNK